MKQENTQLAEQRRQELAHFLQVCRKRLTPEQVGLPPGERRRVKGLRREEVAVLAGISLTWYTWLEQGRAIQVSDLILSRLEQVLQLNDAERAYLFLLAASEPASLPSLLKRPESHGEEALLEALLDTLYPAPALLRDHRWDVLAWNQAEARMIPWPDIAPSERNFLVYLFTHPHAREHLPQWELYTRAILQVFRLTWQQFPSDEQLIALVSSLQKRSSEFSEWWQEHAVQQHPPLELEWLESQGQHRRFSILYLTPPLSPLLFLRVLFPQKS